MSATRALVRKRATVAEGSPHELASTVRIEICVIDVDAALSAPFKTAVGSVNFDKAAHHEARCNSSRCNASLSCLICASSLPAGTMPGWR
jgi:hypothetical protein